MNWLTLLLGKYKFAFISPHSIDRCERILRDYAEQAPFEYYSNEVKVMDIQRESKNMAEVTIHKNLWTFMNKKELSLMRFRGKFQQTEQGTHIIGQVGYTKEALYDIALPFIVSVVMLTSICLSYLSTPPVHYGAVIISLILLVFSIWAFFLPLYRLSRIPYYLLNDDDISSPIPLIWMKPEWVEREKKRWFSNIPILKQENLFFTPLPLEKCATLLLPAPPTGNYQTQWGQSEGAKVGDFTVIIHQQHENRIHFVIRGNDKSRDSQYGQPQSVGALTAMRGGTQVEWVVYNRIVERVFFGCALILSLIGISIIIPHWVMLPISLVIMGLFYRNSIHEALRIARYPRQLLKK